MDSLILSRNDIAFLLYDWLKVETLISRPRYADHSRETFDAVLELSAQLATDLFATHNKTGDQQEARLENGVVRLAPEIETALKAYAEAGLVAAGQDYELGGMQLPAVIEKASFAWFAAANMSTAAFPLLTVANANLILAYGTVEMVDAYVKPMLAGRFFGTMCLSEPHAGSSLAEIHTRADPQADGSYRIFGNKMWISTGEHEIGANIIHLVLARIPAAQAGVKGISLFVVPRFLLDREGRPETRNDVILAGLNHKMGTKGAPNCLLNFGEGAHLPGGAPGAVGWIIGEPGQGLTAMFHMMNEARIAVGISASATGYSSYLHALDYARVRPQGYKAGVRDASARQVPIIEHADVRRMLLQQKCYAEGGLALALYCARLVDDEKTGETLEVRARSRLLLDVLTPIAKSWPSQWCLEASNLAIQVHGGYGYTRDYDVEQLYRDNRLNSIHEGTHGIHAIDLLGRKMVMQGGAGLALLIETILQTIIQAADLQETAGFATMIEVLVARIAPLTAALHGQDQTERRLANASAYLEAIGHIVVGWIWLEQMIAAVGHDSDFHEGKRQTARYFFLWELPRAEMQISQLEKLDSLALDMQNDWF